MPMLAESDLNKIAERVVESFLTRKAGLDESAASEAQSGQLNADQIERLVELVNTQAFLKTMDQRKQDRIDRNKEAMGMGPRRPR